jgi:hypothetical protein
MRLRDRIKLWLSRYPTWVIEVRDSTTDSPIIGSVQPKGQVPYCIRYYEEKYPHSKVVIYKHKTGE